MAVSVLCCEADFEDLVFSLGVDIEDYKGFKFCKFYRGIAGASREKIYYKILIFNPSIN